MGSTHWYLSALVPAFKKSDWYETKYLAKAHLWDSERGGWTGECRIQSFGLPFFKFDALHLRSIQAKLSRRAQRVTKGYTQDELREYGTFACMLAYIHGAKYATWIGEHHVEPVFAQGRTRTRRLTHHLVTEAPGLDCGHWEENVLPS